MHNHRNHVGSAMRSPSRVETKTEVDFPDEILIDIISRLPPKTVLKCRCVCKRWKDLTWTPVFMNLNLRRTAPVTLLRQFWKGSRMCFIDNWLKKGSVHQEEEFPIAPHDTKASNFIQFSHDGLIVMKENSNSFTIYGEEECVKISFAEGLYPLRICGVFFHHGLKEYCTLWHILLYSKGRLEGHYKMLNLGPNPCWKEISNPWVGRCIFTGFPDVFVDGYLYWKSGIYDIIEFDINKEQFSQIPLFPKHQFDIHCNYTMLNIDNLLSIVEICKSNEGLLNMKVWTLQDRAKMSWKKCSYNISLEVPQYKRLEALAVLKGELLLEVDEYLCVCNLKLGTTRKFLKNTLNSLFDSHSMSLVSLRNCKSEIYMNKEDAGHDEL